MEPHDTLPDLAEMRTGIDFRFPVSVGKIDIQLRPLSITETMQALANTVQKFKSLPEAGQNSMAESILTAMETLKFASTPGYGDSKNPALNDRVMDKWTPDQLSHVYKQWVAGVARCSPMLEEMPTEQITELVEEIKKKPRTDLSSTLTERSFLELVNMARYFLTKDD